MKKKAKHPGKTPITYKKKPKTPAQPGSGPAKDVPAAQLPPDRAHRKAPVRDLKSLRLDEGFRPEALLRRFPCLTPWREHWERTLATARAHGLLTPANAPTPRGYEVLDALVRALCTHA